MTQLIYNGTRLQFGSSGYLTIPPEKRFIFKVDTTILITGSSASDTMIINTSGLGYDSMIDWGDGQIIPHTDDDPNLSHTYSVGGVYTIKISGAFPIPAIGNSADRGKLIEILNIGDIGWKTLLNSFKSCYSLTDVTAGYSNISSVTDMRATFNGCASLITVDLTKLDVSSVNHIGWCFQNNNLLTSIDISTWVTSSLSNAYGAFSYNAKLTTLDLSVLDVSNSLTLDNIITGSNNWTDSQYDDVLLSWSQQNVNPNISVGFGDAKYQPSSLAAKTILTDTYNWTITDGGQA